MNFDSAKTAFVQESQELLSDMEAALLELERDAANIDLINAVFRAARSKVLAEYLALIKSSHLRMSSKMCWIKSVPMNCKSMMN